MGFVRKVVRDLKMQKAQLEQFLATESVPRDDSFELAKEEYVAQVEQPPPAEQFGEDQIVVKLEYDNFPVMK